MMEPQQYAQLKRAEPGERKPKKIKIKNPNYRNFLENGQIATIKPDQMMQVMEKIEKGKTRRKRAAKALNILMYFSGARPAECLAVKTDDVTIDHNYVVVNIPGIKKGLPRKVLMRRKDPLVKYFWDDYAGRLMPGTHLFVDFISHYSRRYVNKKGVVKWYTEISDSLRNHFYYWYADVIPGSISPYYLRHNRFSKLAESGASMDEIRQIKGSRTYNSIIPYLHLSMRTAQKIARINK